MIINFESKLLKIANRLVIRIPLNLSEKLPTRGMVLAKVRINQIEIIVPLEPDGSGSHWLEIDQSWVKSNKLEIGEPVSLELEPMEEWIEPEIPEELMNAIIKSNLLNQWNSITPKAKWDWIRWIRFTSNPETHKKRIDIAISKLQKGDKRPCCFDRTRCTITDVSKSGVLLD